MNEARITSFLVKLASRCNLDCDYCYIYHHADQGWRGMPKVISGADRDAFCARLATYVRSAGLTRCVVIFHGGDPLRYFATAGFPREASWSGFWNSADYGPNTLSSFAQHDVGTVHRHAIDVRRRHLLGVFGVLPNYVAATLGQITGPAAMDRELRKTVARYPIPAAAELAKNTAPLLEAVFCIVDCASSFSEMLP